MKTLNQLIEENFSGKEQVDIRSKSQEKITAIHLQQVRKSRRITQKELAQTLGLSQSALSELERRPNKPLVPYSVILKLLEGSWR
ncbi:MAG: XRE family transcriptional regulator [Candidatus Electrothrix sp. AUS1_2]|nr:XRE family transcriptional regulator [Candidatus Electrothrix sp. AUS1_2]